jgi:hypothetical protein
MLKLATLINNPGEPPTASQYNDPGALASLGYTDRVFYETTALSGIESAEVIAAPELRRWVQQVSDHLSKQIEQAQQAGLGVYLFYDCLVLPSDLVQAQPRDVTCRRQPHTLCPASDGALRQAMAGLDALLAQWPGVTGVVLRFGDNDAQRLPHLTGNDIYSPHCSRCNKLTKADRIARFIQAAYDRVVTGHGKRLIVRAWNVRPHGWHDTESLASEVKDRLPGDERDDRLMLSFKFTETDFWRYQRWNAASLRCGNRPIVYELQCQREYEGKGGIPNWQVPLWRGGYPETADQSEVAGLAEASGRVNLAGLWAWVRGGGWGGPFVSSEAWIDANVAAVPPLADDPQADPMALARWWASERLGASDQRAVEAVVAVLSHSPEVMRQAFYLEPVARQQATPWHPNADWIRDDLLDVAAAWRIIQRLPREVLDRVLQEKEAAAEQLSEDRARLQQFAGDRQHHALEPLANTLSYGESLLDTLRDLLAGLIAYRRYQQRKTAADAGVVQQKLLAAQSHWNHHVQRHGALPGTATAFRESQFWELTQQILSEVQ